MPAGSAAIGARCGAVRSTSSVSPHCGSPWVEPLVSEEAVAVRLSRRAGIAGNEAVTPVVVRVVIQVVLDMGPTLQPPDLVGEVLVALGERRSGLAAAPNDEAEVFGFPAEVT